MDEEGRLRVIEGILLIAVIHIGFSTIVSSLLYLYEGFGMIARVTVPGILKALDPWADFSLFTGFFILIFSYLLFGISFLLDEDLLPDLLFRRQTTRALRELRQEKAQNTKEDSEG